ncbi:tetratricopeptide repeat protein [[Flexibacter] sp. ATCC 35103]|uniref:tetratricopeptide repeat protein n=1 Tax=[Flexibacter] sp. ATCC 35103 TaxID=1937528 RepID=UPI0013F62160|nr:tetratricopeptide repeat protein [[Flexibacter] sp. ATCC 35103]
MKQTLFLIISIIGLNSCAQKQESSGENQKLQNEIAKMNDSELLAFSNKLYDSGSESTKAIITLQECVKRNIDKGNSLYRLGVSYIENGETEIGIKKLEESIKINPKYFKAYFNIGAVCYDTQQFEKSVAFYKKSLEIEPQNDASYYGIALSEYALNERKSSKENCEMALKLNPNNENAKLLLQKY